MLVTAEQPTQSALLALWRGCLWLICAHTLRRSTREWLASCILVRILLSLVHLLLELLRLFLVRKAQPGQTVLELEGVKEGPILVVLERIIYFLVPDHPSVCGRHIDHLDPECVAHQVVGEHRSALHAGVGPSVAVGIGDVQFGDCNCVDFVGGLGYCALDRLLVLFAQYGRHAGCSVEGRNSK